MSLTTRLILMVLRAEVNMRKPGVMALMQLQDKNLQEYRRLNSRSFVVP